MRTETKEEATRRWVGTFNCFPHRMLEKLMDADPWDFHEVTIVDEDDENVEYGFLPMWGWLWQFGDSADDYWLEELGGLKIMSDLGFRIYESEEFGYFFGIDGAGFDFYEAFWIPLYEARGLRWHKVD